MDNQAKRDPLPGKPANWCTLDYESVRGLAETNYEGDVHYGFDNWTRGLLASDLVNHALEHIFKLLDGDGSEPHIEHAMWNLGKLRWMAKHKPEFIDLPRMRKALELLDSAWISTPITEFPNGNPSQHGQRSTEPTAPAQNASLAGTPNAVPYVSPSGSGANSAAESGGTSGYLQCNAINRGESGAASIECILERGHDGRHYNSWCKYSWVD